MKETLCLPGLSIKYPSLCLLRIFLEFKAFLYIDILNRHLDYTVVGSLLKAGFKEATVRTYFILYVASVRISNVSEFIFVLYWVPLCCCMEHKLNDSL